jgi:predicted secreted protein
MFGRKLVTAAAFVTFVSTAAFAQTGSSDAARTEALIQQAVQRYTAGLDAGRAQSAQAPQDVAGTAAVPMTLEDAVRRAIDNNLEMAVERLNPQTFDLNIARIQAAYRPTATSQFGQRPGGATARSASAMGPVRAPRANHTAGFRAHLIAYQPASGAPTPASRTSTMGMPSRTPCTLPPCHRTDRGHATRGWSTTGPGPFFHTRCHPADWCGGAPGTRVCNVVRARFGL